MSLQFDPNTRKVTYMGKEVGECIFKEGRSTVRLNIEYESGDDWSVPLSWFALGLSLIAENQPPVALLTIETQANGVAKEFEGVRLLTEKQVKRHGYIWKFHKSDADNWPSPLHGHDYDKGLKLDAITGKIYDAATRTLCAALKASELKCVQDELRKSKDFNDAVVSLIDSAAAAKGSS